MSESTPETNASDLAAGGDKPGGDYGDVSGIGTAADEGAGGAGGGEDGGGDRSDAGGTPDDSEAEEAQRGVQAAFESGIQGG